MRLDRWNGQGEDTIDAIPHLEDYLRTARIVHVVPLPGGGGHQHKQLLILDGGLGVVAKLAEGGDPGRISQQIRSEVAAGILARELGWAELVPTTALRAMRSSFTGAMVAASIQIAWPRFEVAAVLGLNPGSCEESDRWRIAIFDALAANPDRNDGNWGFIDQLPLPKLIDHGHAFDPGQPETTSPFALEKRGTAIPDEYLHQIRAFAGGAATSALGEVLDEAVVQSVFQRASTFVETGDLAF